MRIKIGMGSCGLASGAKSVADALTAAFQQHHISIPLERTGCIGMCFAEPLVEIIDDQQKHFFYKKVDPHRLDGI